MLVKNFEGTSISDAMKKIKKEFGPDAVILSTKEKPIEGGKASVYEVRAASPETKSSSLGAESSSFSDHSDAVNTSLKEISRKLSNYFDTFATHSQLSSMEREMKDLKRICLEILDQKTDFLSADTPEILRHIFHCLSVTGVSKQYLSELVDHMKTVPKPGKDAEFEAKDLLVSEGVRWMIKRIKIGQITPDSSQVHAFVGSSGCGKSSAVTKIAAKFKKENKSILIITLDTQGLASHEQIKTYTKILNIPLVNVYGLDELREALTKNSSHDLILIDNAGNFPFSDRETLALRELSNSKIPLDFHLVLSVNEKQEQLNSNIRKLSPLGLNSLIFTKLDEALNWGEIFNLGYKWSLPLSYFSTGPRIPDDLRPATREYVVEQLFRI
ncbi:MAG: hypothetical protein HYW48_05440 [Deltaproteobacteria bacterium]|nr:hypothetical protein [Deltaproteobacteria bacterium]